MPGTARGKKIARSVCQDELPSTHPVAADAPDTDAALLNLDGISYAKGACVLKQLVAWVGRDAFFGGVAAYLKKHAWGNAELADLFTELETTSGRDLDSWKKLWLETSGVNTLRPELTTDPDGTITSFAVLQSAAPDYPTIRPHRLAIVDQYGILSEDAGAVGPLGDPLDAARVE